MSEVYSLEPPFRGRIILNTTEGELDVHLWSTQCPKAVRNFTQLCLEGFYNNCIFHRVIPQFLVQTGDPTGTGNGGESIYGEPFENEILSRLKFRYRGLVGMANTGGKRTNKSQFFITLDRADCLNGKYTLFGKVEGHTVYNLMKIGECQVDKATDRPLDPPRIINAVVVDNPFPDIVPRLLVAKSEEDDEVLETSAPVIIKKKCLLSFNEDLSDDEVVNSKVKSAHDLLEDPAFSKSSHVAPESASAPVASSPEEPESDREEEEEVVEEETIDESAKRRQEIEELERQLRKGSEKEKKSLDGYSKTYLTRRQMKKQKKENIMDRLASFTKRLSELSKNEKLANKDSEDTDQDLADGSWFAGKKLQFAVDSVRAYEVDAARDTLEVFDPIKGKDNRLEFIANLKKNVSLRCWNSFK
ncbi:peptidyl-prolyl cis-trans isomerase protein, putative [Theileria equi strain WA]|uniref:Peptidyl-prolyl cis-trans isomerase protein, putative n=1 Tax=Theileria equi strain WA TaxID=1537102 RepID=L0AVB3_THEEQ|nr:peptidyl-prolyl cis-trans isomerase protein, putative [Theileria equi strain WA]AFZ79552.1 peptidyl-prolyl cis-trans isomerase protein, putative [Theileria equi strain WA]|eukprot:XP_004829218.1 peptidyl-prolyl cis-trans isomerase protein, putative [Theileria equi strain WA]